MKISHVPTKCTVHCTRLRSYCACTNRARLLLYIASGRDLVRNFPDFPPPHGRGLPPPREFPIRTPGRRAGEKEPAENKAVTLGGGDRHPTPPPAIAHARANFGPGQMMMSVCQMAQKRLPFVLIHVRVQILFIYIRILFFFLSFPPVYYPLLVPTTLVSYLPTCTTSLHAAVYALPAELVSPFRPQSLFASILKGHHRHPPGHVLIPPSPRVERSPDPHRDMLFLFLFHFYPPGRFKRGHITPRRLCAVRRPPITSFWFPGETCGPCGRRTRLAYRAGHSAAEKGLSSPEFFFFYRIINNTTRAP